MAQFDRRQADLVVLRTDAKVPPRARAIAMLEHDVLLLISPKGKKIKSLAALKKKKIAVVGDSENDGVRPQHPRALRRLRTRFSHSTAPPNSTLDKLFASGFGAVIAIAHASKIVKDKSYEQYAKRGRRLYAERHRRSQCDHPENPGISEKVTTGMLSSSPAIPDDDIDTIGLQWLLVAQSKMATGIGRRTGAHDL